MRTSGPVRFPHKMLTRLLTSHIFLVIIPLLVTGQLLTQAAITSIEETIKNRNLEIAKRSGIQVARMIENVQDILNILAENPAIYDMGKLRQELLIDGVVLRYPVFRKLSVVSVDGDIMSSTAFMDDSADEATLKAAYPLETVFGNDGRPSKVFLSPEGLPIMQSCHQITDNFDMIVGALCAEVDLTELWKLVDSIVESKVLGEEGETLIVNADGRLIAHTDRARVLSSGSFDESDILANLRRGEARSEVYTAADDREMILAYAPITPLGWGIVLQQPTREAFAPARRMQFQVLLLMLASLAVASLVAYLYTRNILRPVDRLVAGINRISRGDLRYRIAEVGKDEISQLAGRFNEMASRLRTIQTQLTRTERLETLGKLASVLSHEIRNPLNSMVINMQILQREYRKSRPDHSKLEHYHSVVVSEIKRVDALVSNFLKFARPAKLEKERVDLAHILDELIMAQQPLVLPKGIRIERHYDQEAVYSEADANKLKQVFLNIIINAAQAMPGGGKLDVSVHLQQAQDALAGRMIQIRFSDSGKGIEPGEVQHIFDFYYSTKSDGTGVGLAVAQQIIEEHGGHIHVESELGKGTDVVVELPESLAESVAS